MAKSYQKTQVLGNVGRDPVFYEREGKQVSHFSVAVNRRVRGSDGLEQERVIWFSCTAVGRLAEVVQEYVKKGCQVFAEGRLDANEYGHPKIYTPANGNDPVASFDLFVTDLVAMGNGNNGGAESEDGIDF